MKTKAGREAWRHMHQLMFGTGQPRFFSAAATVGLTPGQMKTLLNLTPGEGVSMRDLAETWRCDPSYVTGLADEMEDRGLAVRRPHPTDRRVKMLVLTDEGEAARARALEVLYEPPDAINVLNAEEQRQLRELLQRIVEADPAAARGFDGAFSRAREQSRLAGYAKRRAAHVETLIRPLRGGKPAST